MGATGHTPTQLQPERPSSPETRDPAAAAIFDLGPHSASFDVEGFHYHSVLFINFSLLFLFYPGAMYILNF